MSELEQGKIVRLTQELPPMQQAQALGYLQGLQAAKGTESAAPSGADSAPKGAPDALPGQLRYDGEEVVNG
ncbi:MAG: hypothetical protein IJV64_09955 [Oscillospiraceae bacterium]|nr:hypothetical protein [Oscillospiraceae bacterium]